MQYSRPPVGPTAAPWFAPQTLEHPTAKPAQQHMSRLAPLCHDCAHVDRAGQHENSPRCGHPLHPRCPVTGANITLCSTDRSTTGICSTEGLLFEDRPAPMPLPVATPLAPVATADLLCTAQKVVSALEAAAKAAARQGHQQAAADMRTQAFTLHTALSRCMDQAGAAL